MQLTDNQRLYQQIAFELKNRIEQGFYNIGDKLPAERLIAEEMNVSRTVVREAIIMLEVEGYVVVRKGSGIHVVSTQSTFTETMGNTEFSSCGPFELLQARQLIESNIAEFAATQATKEDILKLMEIQSLARKEQNICGSEWDLHFHTQVAAATHNIVMVKIVEELWTQRGLNPYWQKLREHVNDNNTMESWCDEHDKILKALVMRDPHAAKVAMWEHLEKTKQDLFDATSDNSEFDIDRYMFTDNPVVHLTHNRR